MPQRGSLTDGSRTDASAPCFLDPRPCRWCALTGALSSRISTAITLSGLHSLHRHLGERIEKPAHTISAYVEMSTSGPAGVAWGTCA